MDQSALVFRACGGLCKAIAFMCPATPEAPTTTAWLSCGLMIWRRYWMRAVAPSGGHRPRVKKKSFIPGEGLYLAPADSPPCTHVPSFPTRGPHTGDTPQREAPPP